MSTLDLNTTRLPGAPFAASLFGKIAVSLANGFHQYQVARMISVMNQMTDVQLAAIDVERAAIPAHVGRILPRD